MLMRRRKQIVKWPAVPVVARAYMDQLQRENRLTTSQAGELSDVLERAEALLGGGDGNRRSTVRALNTLAVSLMKIAISMVSRELVMHLWRKRWKG